MLMMTAISWLRARSAVRACECTRTSLRGNEMGFVGDHTGLRAVTLVDLYFGRSSRWLVRRVIDDHMVLVA
jgi:hypothetical protein